MDANKLKEIDEIEQLAIDVSCLISVTKNSCQSNDYTCEQIVLEHAMALQDEVIDKIINLSNVLLCDI